MTLYEAIFVRRSVRKYDMNSISDDEMSEITEFLQGIIQLNGCNARFKFVKAGEVSNKWAPHYILAYCDKTTADFINVGYVLQKVDLYLQSRGFGSVWLGMGKPSEEKEDYAIMLAFGRTEVPERKSAGDFKRLDAAAATTGSEGSEINEVVKAALLSPSAMNSQPWILEYKENKLTIDYKGRGLLAFQLKKRMSKVDIGIITQTAEVALLHAEKKILDIEVVVSDKKFGTIIHFE